MISSKIRRVCAATGAGLMILACPAHAEEQLSETVPPVEQASFHQLLFADGDFAVLKNNFPPSSDSGFHAHFRDLYYVVIQAAQTGSQSPGKPLNVLPKLPVGAAAYSPVGDGPRIHRVVNGDTVPYQIIAIELRRASPSGSAISSRQAAPQYIELLDNPRMRAWRLILEPGQSAPAITQTDKGVRVVVRGGLLTTIVSGSPAQRQLLEPGDVAIQSAGWSRALRNDGAETIELVEVELK